MLDPSQQEPSENQNTGSSQSSELVQAPGAIKQVTPGKQPSWFSKHAFGIVYVCLVLTACVSLGWIGQRVAKSVLSFATARNRQTKSIGNASHPIDEAIQAQAEQTLKRLASGDPAAADLVFLQSDNWTGKTHRTQNTDQLVTAAINLPDKHLREAAIQAQLALDGITRDETGLNALKQVVGNPRMRPWALWSLGALGNRGVDPVHTAKIVEAYLDDPSPYVRAEAVDGLALLATDETVPMLLDRFRNDPSPLVQEHAACDMAQSGMYTHDQRMRAAASFVGWLDDPLLTAQQRTWTLQALHDITGASPGSDAGAWRNWWSQKSRR